MASFFISWENFVSHSMILSWWNVVEEIHVVKGESKWECEYEEKGTNEQWNMKLG